ncbi:MAG: ribosome recycling factor [Planctomycetota bacterium]|nr:ribosome recycling factor [Planctomycetota bacterium]
MDIDEALLDGEDRMIKTIADYEHFLKGVRTGEASIELLDSVHVDIPSYGGVVSLKSVALVTKQGSQMLIVKPFDPNTLKEIEKALQASDLGITPNNDGKIIRLAFPPMSEERRTQTVKMIKERLEQHKVALRNIRKDAMKHVDGNKGAAGVSEDALKQAKDDVQELTKQYETQLDELFEKKSKEVMTV